MGIDIKRLPAPIKAFFNGIAQVVFIENVISGMFFYVSFWIAGLEMANWDFASWDAWKYVVAVTIGVNLSNLTAYLMGCDKNAIKSGLYGFAPNLFSSVVQHSQVMHLAQSGHIGSLWALVLFSSFHCRSSSTSLLTTSVCQVSHCHSS